MIENNNLHNNYGFIIRPKRLFACFFCLLVILPYFSSEFGVSIGEFKISIADMILFFYLFIFTAKRVNLKKTFVNLPEMEGWMILIVMWILMIPIGLMNGASIGECFRLVRNLLYIPISFLILSRYLKNGIVDRLIEIFSVIVVINTLINAFSLYRINGWFQFYRANGILTVFLFCYLFYRVKKSVSFMESICKVLCCIGLVLGAFFSQERTQLITMFISCFIVWLYNLLFCKTHMINKRNIGKKVLLLFVVCCILIFSIKYVLRIEYVQKYISYYLTYRLQGGNIFGQEGLMSDGSYQARILQIYNIVRDNINPLYLFIGRGTCAYYQAAQGLTYIVDSVVLWVFKDLGIVGVSILFLIIWKMLRLGRKIDTDYKLAIMSSGLSLVFFMFYNPSFIYTASVSFTIGLYEYLKYSSIK